MNRITICVVCTLLLASGPSSNDAFARGFGGFRGGGGFGGFHGGGGFGGFHGGGFGGFHGGGFGGGGFGGFHGGGFGGGGYHGGGFGGGDFGRGGFGGEGGYRGNEGAFGRSEAGNYAGIGQRETSGYRGGEGNWGGGFRGDAAGLGGEAGRWGGSLNRGELNGFLGLPTDGGMHAASGALANRGFNSGQMQRPAFANGTHPFSQTWAHSQGKNVQNWANDHPAFTNSWNSAHPWAWSPTGVDAAAWGAAAWAGAAWPALGGWLGWGVPTYYPYDYGENITYDGDEVYYGSQPAGTAQQYYQEAANLAATAPAASASDAQWLPLGIFGLVAADGKTPTLTFQLAVNKQGIIRGNSTNQYSDVLPLQGAVEKKTQRVCWTVGSDSATVYDTGLYNLTKNESPILIHSGPKSTQQEMLVRLKQPPGQSGNGSISSTR